MALGVGVWISEGQTYGALSRRLDQRGTLMAFCVGVWISEGDLWLSERAFGSAGQTYGLLCRRLDQQGRHWLTNPDPP